MHLCICFGVVHFKEYGKKPFPKKFTFLVDMSAKMKFFFWGGGMNSLECIIKKQLFVHEVKKLTFWLV